MACGSLVIQRVRAGKRNKYQSMTSVKPSRLPETSMALAAALFSEIPNLALVVRDTISTPRNLGFVSRKDSSVADETLS
jgi:hypothetical protein